MPIASRITSVADYLPVGCAMRTRLADHSLVGCALRTRTIATPCCMGITQRGGAHGAPYGLS